VNPSVATNIAAAAAHTAAANAHLAAATHPQRNTIVNIGYNPNKGVFEAEIPAGKPTYVEAATQELLLQKIRNAAPRRVKGIKAALLKLAGNIQDGGRKTRKSKKTRKMHK
jgi:hypothetical protein